MSEQTYKSTDGSCIISQQVIATIACNAALEVDGVASMAQRPMNLRGMVQSADMRSVAVTSNANETVLDVYVHPKMDAHIPTMAEAIQTAVKTAVQSMAGSPVTKVNVHVARALAEPQTTEQQAE
ncbi:MAG: Asp23/Gls24 family envelope stress response protein [Ruminococcaceae bacterium]|nr:Asp23/Gls24 family envelope stress response protein [Oscillospiraceae bacterium]